MFKKIFVIVVAVVLVSGFLGSSFAMCGMCPGDKPAAKESTSAAVNVGNTICPISGEKIDEKAKATYEHEGKTYNFCCPMCIDEFKKDPQKYIEKLEAAEKEEAAGRAHGGAPSGHQGHRH